MLKLILWTQFLIGISASIIVEPEKKDLKIIEWDSYFPTSTTNSPAINFFDKLLMEKLMELQNNIKLFVKKTHENLPALKYQILKKIKDLQQLVDSIESVEENKFNGIVVIIGQNVLGALENTINYLFSDDVINDRNLKYFSDLSDYLLSNINQYIDYYKQKNKS